MNSELPQDVPGSCWRKDILVIGRCLFLMNMLRNALHNLYGFGLNDDNNR